MIETIVIIKNRKSVINANRYRYSSLPDTNVISRKQRKRRSSISPLCIEVNTDTSFFLCEILHTTASVVYKSISMVITYFDNSIT